MKPYNTAIRLKEIMGSRNIKQVDILNMCKPFCKKYDIKLGKNDLSQYVNGKVEPGQEKLYILAEALNVSEAWLMGYDVPMQETNANNNELESSNMITLEQKLYNIPVYENASAGFGATAIDCVVDYIPLPFTSKTEADETICIKVKGDSMSPKIENGDIIQVRKQSSVDSGDIAVVLIDGGEGFVKKVEYDIDYIRLVSLNPSYDPYEFKGADVLRVTVVGKVKKIIRDL